LPRPLGRAVRISNKYLLNPVLGALAGRKNPYAAAIRHTGTKSIGTKPRVENSLVRIGLLSVRWRRTGAASAVY